MKFSPSGMELAVGTGDGTVALFDLRSSTPTVSKDHMYDAAIHSLHYLDPQSKANADQANKIASADRFVVKIWDTVSGETYTNVEPGNGASINDLCWWSDSGLFFAACDDSRIQVRPIPMSARAYRPFLQSYFVPSLGMAPPWCSFLEGMTEELEEESGKGCRLRLLQIPKSSSRSRSLRRLQVRYSGGARGRRTVSSRRHGSAQGVHARVLRSQQTLHEVRSRDSSDPEDPAPLRARAMNKQSETRRSDVAESRISSEKRALSKRKASMEKAAVDDERFRAIHDDPAFRIEEGREANLDGAYTVRCFRSVREFSMQIRCSFQQIRFG